MPINPKMKAIIEADTTMTADYKRKLLETFEDAPSDFQNGWIANQDYQRNMHAFNEEKKTWKVTADEFYNKSNANIDAWKAEVKKANDTAAALQNRIAELETSGGAPGTGGMPSDAALKEITALKDAISKIQTGMDEKLKAVTTQDDLNKAYANAVGFIGDQVITLGELNHSHQETFGSRLTKADTEALLAFANETSTKLGRRITLDDAYKLKYGDEIQKKHDEQVAAAAIEKYKTTHETPGGGPAGPGPSPMELGPLQQRLNDLRRAEGGDKAGVYQSWQEAANAGGAELVKEGKS